MVDRTEHRASGTAHNGSENAAAINAAANNGAANNGAANNGADNNATANGSAADALTVASCLAIPPLHSARVVAGSAGLDRPVRWVSFAERPVESVVMPGDFVLTQAVDCDEGALANMVTAAATAGAAALGVTVGGSAVFARVPEKAIAAGDEAGLPVIAIGRSIRHTTISRTLIERIFFARYEGKRLDSEQMPLDFTDALLRHDGLAAIAHALEKMVDHPAVVLDSAYEIIAAGPLADDRLAADHQFPTTHQFAADDESTDAPRRTTESATDMAPAAWWCVDSAALIPVPTLSVLPGGGVIAPALASGQTLGYVVVATDAPAAFSERYEHPLRHAAAAVAIETLRRRAAAEAEARLRGDFLWEIVTGGQLTEREIATKAVLLGYPLRLRFQVVIAESTAPSADTDDEDVEHLDEVVNRVRPGIGPNEHVSRRGRNVLMVLRSDSTPERVRAWARAVISASDGADPVRWAIADGTYRLPELCLGFRRASRALGLGRTVGDTNSHGDPDPVTEATKVAPFMILAALADDADARASAENLLRPLLSEAAATIALPHTLDVFLAHNGNTSSAARALYLNRHSLIYRLHRIEELTGHDLSDHETRFLFELSLRLWKIRHGTLPT